MNARDIADMLSKTLKLDTYPIAVRLAEKRDELREEPLSLKLNNCQLISMARHGGLHSSGVPDRMVCSIGAACVGLVKTPEEFTGGTAAVGKYTVDSHAGITFFRNTFKIGDSGAMYEGIEFAPLGKALFQPMAVIIYGNPAQIMRLVHANAWNNGEMTTGDTVAEAAVCSSIGLAVSKNRTVLGLPCAGDRRFGGTQNHEMVFVTPWETLAGRIAPALNQMFELQGSLYPVAPCVLYETRMPDAYTL